MLTSKKVRLDKWLWAARFFKTRSMAANAVSGGKVHFNGKRVKSAKNVQMGDELRIKKGQVEFVVIIKSINDKRRPFSEAALLYEETEESINSRQEKAEERRLQRDIADNHMLSRRPSKRDRRLIRSFIKKS